MPTWYPTAKDRWTAKLQINSDWVGSNAESVHCLRNRSRKFAMLAANDVCLLWDSAAAAAHSQAKPGRGARFRRGVSGRLMD